MSIVDLGLLPSGHLHCFTSLTDGGTDNAVNNAAIGKAFTRSVGEGLFTLAGKKLASTFPRRCNIGATFPPNI